VLKRSKRTWSPTVELRRGPKEVEPGGGCLLSMTNRLSSALEPVCHSPLSRTPGSATLEELFEAPPLSSCGSGIDVPRMLTWLNQFSLGVFSVNLHSY
jgi:hypothetical protein